MNLTYDNIVSELLSTFPEFDDFDKDNLDIPHVIIGNFAEFLTQKIERDNDLQLILKIFDFINSLFFENNDRKLFDLIQVELFENLAQSEKAIIFSRQHLNGEAKRVFEKAVSSFGIKNMRIDNK